MFWIHNKMCILPVFSSQVLVSTSYDKTLLRCTEMTVMTGPALQHFMSSFSLSDVQGIHIS